MNTKKKKKNKAIVMWSNNRNTQRFSFYYIYSTAQEKL